MKLFIILAFLEFVSVVAEGQKTIPLYSGKIPNAKDVKDEEFTQGNDPATHLVSRPTLTVYLPADKKVKRTAVIICPGGGYGSLVINREGHDVAKALQEKGISAFVLKYRLPSDKTMIDRSIGPLQDAQQAIKIIRERSEEFNIDPSKVGIMGFSAGGHLAASAGILHHSALIPNPKNTSLRPDFMILVYPVITMDTLVGHKGSVYNLLGSKPDAEKIKAFSLHLQVNESTPPAYITVATNDDMLSSTLLLNGALHKYRISTELHIYSTGGHGFLKYPLFTDWMRLVLSWMRINQWLE